MKDVAIEDLENFTSEIFDEINEVAFNRKQRRVMKSVVRSVIKKAKVKYKTLTLRKWFYEFMKVTDHQPIGQRLPVDSTDDKSQKIIYSLIRGKGVGQITMCTVKGNEMYKWESIDGGHRKRAIRDFMLGKIPFIFEGTTIWFESIPKDEKGKSLKGRVFNDVERNDFMNIKISLQIFSGLSNEEKGKLFRTINDTSTVKEQEMLNSFGDVPAANFIRETVRKIAGKNNIINELFTPEGNHIHRMKWLSQSNVNLKQEEFLSKVCFRIWNKKLNGGTLLGAATTGKDSGDLMDMFNHMTQNEANKVKLDVTKVLSFLKEMSIATQGKRKTEKLTWKEQISLTHFYFWMCDTFGKNSFKILDYEKFFGEFCKAVDFYHKDDHVDENGVPIIDKAWNALHETQELPVSTNFATYQTEFVQVPKIKKMVEWLVEAFNWNEPDVFMELDKQRLFPLAMKEKALRKQGHVCYIDGTPLDYKDAEAAHIDAHCKGGYTTQSNIAMVHKKYNKQMGSMNLHNYMKDMGFGDRVPNV